VKRSSEKIILEACKSILKNLELTDISQG
jgi:hypothetical protein